MISVLRIPMMAMTSNSSINVKPSAFPRDDFRETGKPRWGSQCHMTEPITLSAICSKENSASRDLQAGL
jgi:hypothetical protein